jgi:hypothetical protein
VIKTDLSGSVQATTPATEVLEQHDPVPAVVPSAPDFKGVIPVNTTNVRADQTPAIDRVLGTGARLLPPPITGAKQRDTSKLPVFDVVKFGAKGDDKTDNTKAIQAAIDACPTAGGIVRIPSGTFVSGMITLKNNIVLQLQQGAVLKGTLDVTKYPDTHPRTNNTQLNNCRKALIYAEKADSITIEGPGQIDGTGDNKQWNGKEPTRPMAIYTALCSNVTIQNVSVKNAAMWGVVNLEGKGVTLDKVNVDSMIGATRDGLDIVDCHNVLIQNCTVKSEDDSICIKSGSSTGTKDVLVKNCTVNASSVANGLKFGTASTGSFENVTFDTIQVSNVAQAAMAVESVDGAVIQGIRFNNITLDNVGTPFFILLGARGSLKNVGQIDGVTFENIKGNSNMTNWGAMISGSPSAGGTINRVKNVHFRHVDLTFKGGSADVPTVGEYDGLYPDARRFGKGGKLSAWALLIRHVLGITFEDVHLHLSGSDQRPAIDDKLDVANEVKNGLIIG